MIAESLDHLVILVADHAKAVATYETLLGRRRDWQHMSAEDGTVTTQFALSNTTIELLAPHGSGSVGDRIRELLGDREGLLTSLVFRTSDIGDAHYLCHRRGLKPGSISHQAANYSGLSRRWARFRCEAEVFGEVKVFILQQEENELPYLRASNDAVTRLDHVVINTGNPDRAMASYGARLDLRLALDRTNEDWGARFLFFRTGDTTLEVINRLDNSMTQDDPDALWGMTYEIEDLDAAHERLSDRGVKVSEVRKGRKPGTRVMSVKSHDLGVPTLLLDTKG